MEEKYQSTEHGIELKELREFVRQHGETVSYDKGEQLECEGEPARWWAFIEEGYFKYVVRGISNGREHISWFSCEGEFVGAYPDVLDGGKAQTSIEAMTPCRVVRISGEQLEQFFSQSKETERLGRRITAHVLKQFQRRSIILLAATPLERYKLLLEHCPGIINELPLGALASYLGISQKTLSIVRRELTDSNFTPPILPR